ncbi:hypothetical protein OE88DRAFT_1637892 [Heliocybe sulcata]|uniref:Protein kinase domain-containing protein n=1 Tax=Heliocybe sulcata TaxID=5364 RepID=A0A5C3MMP8_9AGAM|nr:hypothetical protein OE88DRAFT_1637892 [Heliocybe sulcata]
MGVDPLIAREQTFPDPPKYTHCVAPIEIKCQAALRWGHDAVQLAVYARECFVQQPNRDLVYASLLTEEQMQLHQFDRGGDLHSSFFNIHEDPVTFVKMILALSTEDLEKLGFDTRIYWDGSRRYFRTISEDSREVKIYTISEPDHPFRRHTICGRGTTCWVIQNETGEKVVLKLAWRTFERLPEWHFLEKICEENRRRALEEPERGPIPGVGTILAHWEGKRLSELRFGVALKTPDEQTVSDRRFYYTLQPYLGAALEKAASTLQSLRALYDIIQGQRELYDLKILHRDISTRNMLCNPDPEAQAGQRGFLIDFDMAKKLDSPSNTAGADERTGTRAFQSIKVLEGLGVHDYLDDLESTFWAYTWIVCTSDGPGVARLGVPVDLINWGSQDLAVAILAKRNFLARPLVDLIHPAMGRHVRVLILWFAGFFQDTALARIRRLEQERYQGMLEKDADVQRAAVFLRQDGLGNDASGEASSTCVFMSR